MESSSAVLITGAGSGIGKHLALVLTQRGCRVTVADLDLAAVQSVAEAIREAGGMAEPVQCDVCSQAEQERMFEAHMRAFGRLDAAILNAGVGELGSLLKEGDQGWQKTLQVDLWAVCVGVQLASQHMAQRQTKGTILVNASAGGLFEMPYAPVYAAAKAGCVNLVRSLAPPLGRRGIRIAAVCPQVVETPLAAMFKPPPGAKLDVKTRAELEKAGQHQLTTEQVCEAFTFLLDSPEEKGTILMLHAGNKRAYRWQPPKSSLVPVDIQPQQEPADTSRRRMAYAAWAAMGDRSSNPAIVVQKLSNKFREVTSVESQPLPDPLPEGYVLVRHAWAGVNASDVNFTSGRYFGIKEATRRLPFPAGFEAVGAVAAVGPGVSGLQVGDAVAHLSFGSFARWGIVMAKEAMPISRLEAPVLALLTSGLTASIGLEVAGQIRSGETVLVTAAAGGTGQFVVQVAKAAGCHIIALCSNDIKAAMLKRLGADRVVDYKREDLGAILRREYPKGVDVVWETVGGKMFDTCARNLAMGGRLLVIGLMSVYGEGWPASQVTGLPEQLLSKSASVRGFFLTPHARCFKSHLRKLLAGWESGKLQVTLDSTHFRGLEAVADAVEHLQSGTSMGKVVVQIAQDLPPTAISAL